MRIIRLAILLFSITLLLLPVLLFPPRLPPEFLVLDDWVLDEQSEIAPSVIAGGEWRSLALGGDLFYVSSGGKSGVREIEDYYLDFTDTGFINTSQYHSTLVHRSPEGDVLEVLDTRGFPVFAEDYLFILDSDGLGFSLLDELREEVFVRRWSSPISVAKAIRFGGRRVFLVGLLDGRFFVFDEGGSIEDQGVQGSASRYPVLYGADFAVLPPGPDTLDERLVLITVGGFGPASLDVFELVPDSGGQLRLIKFQALEMPIQLLSPAAIETLAGFDGGVDISVSSAEGTALFRVGDDEPILVLEDFEPDVRNVLLSPIEGYAGLSLRHLSGDTASLLEIQIRRSIAIISRGFDFPSAFSIDGNNLYLRGAGTVSAYILEEG